MDFLLAEINRKSKQIEQNEVTSVSILSLWQTVILIVKGVVVQSEHQSIYDYDSRCMNICI